MKPQKVSPTLLKKMGEGKAIKCEKCNEPGCNVKYGNVRKGILACKGCYELTFCKGCYVEKRRYELESGGLYDGYCTDCASCSECGEPMWDYICGSCWRKQYQYSS